MTNFDATHRILTLGARDDTGWYKREYYNETDSDGEAVPETLILIPKASQRSLTGMGTYVRSDALGLTLDPVKEGDQYIKNLKRYEVIAVRDIPHLGGDSLSRREVDLELLQFENLAGRTYVESDFEDARYRTKVYLESYFGDYALPYFLVAYGDPPYPITQVFKIKGHDVIFRLGEPTADALIGFNDKAYGYHEQVPVFIDCIDKANIDGDKLRWQAETELRRILEAYPSGSLRMLKHVRGNNRYVGGYPIYGSECVFDYLRVADQAHTTASISYGHQFLVDFTDAETTTVAATEAESGLACTPTNLDDDYMVMDGTMDNVADEYATYTVNPTDFSTTAYTTYIIRWMTEVASAGVGLRVVANFSAGTQELLESGGIPQFSTTLTTTSGTFTTTKTLQTFSLIPDDYPDTENSDTEYAVIDFILACEDTFTFPNIVTVEPRLSTKALAQDYPMRSGDAPQILGTNSLALRLTCDLSVGDWTRTDDTIDAEVFHELWHEGGHNAHQPWVWLDLENYAFKAIIDNVDIQGSGANRRLIVDVHEYNRSSTDAWTVQERLGI